jgi:hypothetical protein
MAVLGESDRAEVWAEYMRDGDGAPTITKAQLRAVVNAIDDWVDANATSFNTAIPQPQRSELTTKQKAALLVYVVIRRHLVT